jgi:hypothetical protein
MQNFMKLLPIIWVLTPGHKRKDGQFWSQRQASFSLQLLKSGTVYPPRCNLVPRKHISDASTANTDNRTTIQAVTAVGNWLRQ